MLNAKCSHCGSPNAALEGVGRVLFAKLDDVSELCALFSGATDDQPCAVCEKPLGVSMTVVVVNHRNTRALVALGSMMLSHPKHDSIWQDVVNAAKQSDVELQVIQCADHSALRDEVRVWLRELIDVFLDLFTLDAQAQLGRIELLDASNFCAVQVGRRVPSSGLWLNSTSGDDIYGEIARVQAFSWLLVCRRWLRPPIDGAQLGRDLDRHIRPDALLPGADTAALRLLEQEQQQRQTSNVLRYVFEAVRAAIHASAGTKNPNAKAWASCHFTLQMQRRLGSEDGRRVAESLSITPEQAAVTIDFGAAWDAVLEQLGHIGDRPDPRARDALRAIAEEAGHPTLMDQVFSDGIQLRVPDLTPEKLVEMAVFAQRLPDKDSAGDALVGMSLALGEAWCREGRVDEVEATVDLLLAGPAQRLDQRARLLAWLGECCKVARQPRRLLDRIGDEVQPWESTLPASAAVSLGNERANALRLAGRTRAALSATEALMSLLPEVSQGDQRTIRRNRAILLRELGDVEGAANELELLLESAQGFDRIGLLESLAICYSQLGRQTDERRCLEEAVQLCRGPHRKHLEAAQAQLALAMVQASEIDEARTLLIALDAVDNVDPFVLFPVASAWATLLGNQVTLEREDLAAAEHCHERLGVLASAAMSSGDAQGWLDALRLRALLKDLAGESGARAAYQAVHAACEQLDLPLEMYEVLGLARTAYWDGEIGVGRAYLQRLPTALETRVSQVRDMPSVSQVLERALTWGLDDFTEAVLEHGSFEDVRLIAEMRREVVARAQRYARNEMTPGERDALAQGLDDAALARLAPACGKLAVHEWIETDEAYLSFITVIEADGSVTSHWLPAHEVELTGLAVKMSARLRDWTPGRPGDPFDWPAWQSFEHSFVAAMQVHLGADAHVVFIEHDDFAGLPWHAAVAGHWSASYAAGWGMLLALHEPQAVAKDDMGLAVVPRHRESDDVLLALQAGAQAVRALAVAHGHTLAVEEGGHCDRTALSSLLCNVHSAVLLCHGFVARKDHEVALMVASHGALPPANSVAANATRAQLHRFGWRECAGLPQAPSCVYAAACSSNLSHVVGLGERAGLFAALHRAGTRCLAAPRWDVVAGVFVPILINVVRCHRFGDVPLARAVREACAEAQKVHARWMCWALSVEGDWR